MSLFSPTPIVSVVVPCFGDEAAFENTLVSVLENRPRLCEVIVAHDGSYRDPFDLEDEVRFAVATRGDLPALIRAGADQAKGRLVHVLAEGHCATEGWIDELLATPGDLCPAILVPVSLQTEPSDQIATIGWSDRASGFCRPVAAGKQVTSLPRQIDTSGPTLRASIWRTDVLRALSTLPTGADPELTQYAWTLVARRAGFDCKALTGCRIREPKRGVGYGPQSAFTARHMQAVRAAVEGSGLGVTVAGGLIHLVCNTHRPSAYRESVGRLTAPLIQGSYQQRFAKAMRTVLQTLEEWSIDDEETHTLRFPDRGRSYSTTDWTPRRRAA